MKGLFLRLDKFNNRVLLNKLRSPKFGFECLFSSLLKSNLKGFHVGFLLAV